MPLLMISDNEDEEKERNERVRKKAEQRESRKRRNSGGIRATTRRKHECIKDG